MHTLLTEFTRDFSKVTNVIGYGLYYRKLNLSNGISFSLCSPCAQHIALAMMPEFQNFQEIPKSQKLCSCVPSSKLKRAKKCMHIEMNHLQLKGLFSQLPRRP